MRSFAALVLLLLAAHPAAAQDASTEDKLREALRRSTVDLRALQDSQAQLQADRDGAIKQRDLLQQQVTDLTAKLADALAKPKIDPAVVKQLQDQLAAAAQQNAALAASNAKWQAAYQQAAALARQRDADAKRLAAGLQAAAKVNDADHADNQKLAALASDILHLYRTQNFRQLLWKSYEPLLGLYEVKLENTVQYYEDKIYNLRLFVAKAQHP
jgi:hypothetical protein